MSAIKPPDASLQVRFHQLLVGARKCESRPVAWRTSVAAAVLSNGTRIACVGRTEAEAETMRRAAESQKEPR